MPGLSQNDCLPDKGADGDGGPEAVVHATRYESKEVSVAHERTERIWDWRSKVVTAEARKAGSASECNCLIPRPPTLIEGLACNH